MRRWICFALLLVLVPASAQSEDAPHPAPDAAVLYGHGTGSDEANGFMNTLEEDGGDNALGPSASCAVYEGISELADDISRTYTFTLAPELVDAVMLEGTIEATAHIGAGSCDGDAISVTSKLEHGGTLVAESEAVTHTWSGGAPYPEVTMTMETDEIVLEPGQGLVWTLSFSGTYYGQVFLGISDEQGHSRISLPIQAVDSAPQMAYVDLQAGAADIDLGALPVQYNWTVDEPRWDLSFTGDLSGPVGVTLVDAANVTIYDATLEGAVAANESVTGEPGSWTMRLMGEATGNLSFSFAALGGDGGDGGDGADGDGGDGGDGAGADGEDGEDGNLTSDDSKGSPAPGLIALPILGLIAWFRRR